MKLTPPFFLVGATLEPTVKLLLQVRSFLTPFWLPAFEILKHNCISAVLLSNLGDLLRAESLNLENSEI